MEQTLPGRQERVEPKVRHNRILATFTLDRAMTSAHVHAAILRDGNQMAHHTLQQGLCDLVAMGRLVRIRNGLYCLPAYKDPAHDLPRWIVRTLTEHGSRHTTRKEIARLYRMKEGRPLPDELFAIAIASLERSGHLSERGPGRYAVLSVPDPLGFYD